MIRRLGTTPSPSAIGLVLAFVLTVSALTAAQAAHAISVEALAASPRNVAAGKVWLLVTSGLVVQSPLALSLLSFTLLALLTLFVCGSQVLWAAAVALFAWMLRGHLNVLDSEHVLAFGIGAALAGPRWKLAARPARPGFAAAASASQGAPGSRA